MMLDAKLTRVLGLIQFQAAESVPEIAAQAGLREHVVRRSIAALTEMGIIRPYTIINPYRLGFSEYGIFFQRASGAASDRARLVSLLTSTPGVGGFSEFAGHFHYGLLFYCKSANEIEALLDTVSTSCPGYILECSLVNRVAWTALRCKYLAAEPAKIEALGAESGGAPVMIDEIDHRILAALGRSPAPQRKDLQKLTNLPHSTLDYRLKALKAKGVIVGHGYWVHSHKLGANMFRLFVTVKTHSARFRKEMTAFAFEDPNITGFARCLGHWDYEIRAECFGTRPLAELTERMHAKFGEHIIGIKVANLVENHRISLYPFGAKDTAALGQREAGAPRANAIVPFPGNQAGTRSANS